jgi:glucosyl-3-phosphoglycerate synthase
MLPPFRWEDWSIPALLEAKAAEGVQVSLVLPAYNEAETVGGIVARVRADLIDGPGFADGPALIDEIVVIDSDSDDDTAGQARAAGAKVHISSEILPELEPVRGKGEAIWKSLFVTSGDIIAFLDADLTEWDTHFVTGVLGPLLVDRRVELVKGFYDRLASDPAGSGGPGVSVRLAVSGSSVGSGGSGVSGGSAESVSLEGGRVTELVARPLLNRRWPALSAIVQPLAGEWAVRRSTLEALGVPVGYGVDLAALIDVHLRSGPRAIAQVDLGRRGHQHQSLRDLGAMALELIAVTDRRAGVGGPVGEVAHLRQFVPGTDGAEAVTRSVFLLERPPAVSVPAYRERAR